MDDKAPRRARRPADPLATNQPQKTRGMGPLLLGAASLMLFWLPVVGLILGACALVLAEKLGDSEGYDARTVTATILGSVGMLCGILLAGAVFTASLTLAGKSKDQILAMEQEFSTEKTAGYSPSSTSE
ncbi:MAG: hypothetical protein Q4B30_04875 [Coriobacteriaceae bacterium]|nr:hypothetical protein [Coriobacteriaceae bacterium]